jgi:glucose-1-phosphate thymidylyltransferase
MTDSLKIIILMAGFGTRMRPHTWSRPKALLSAAGDTILGHMLKMVTTIPDEKNIELVYVVGYLGDSVRSYVQSEFPNVTAHFIEQKELLGQSHALAQAREYLQGPIIVILGDAIFETDFAAIHDQNLDAIAWVKPVEDPRRFGVAAVNSEGLVTELIEKPSAMTNNLAVVGMYYFRRGEDLLAAIDEQMDRGISLKKEFYLAQAIDIMLKKGLRMRTQEVADWLDAGVPETVLETNRKLLDKGRDNSAEASQRSGVTIKPPVHIHPSATVENSTLGPYVTVGRNSIVRNSSIEDSILESGVTVEESTLRHSLLGERSQVRGVRGQVNVGDDSQVAGEQG